MTNQEQPPGPRGMPEERRGGSPSTEAKPSLHPEQVRIYRAMTPARKLEIAAEFQAAARRLKAGGLRSQHPDWSEEQIQRKVRELFLYAE